MFSLCFDSVILVISYYDFEGGTLVLIASVSGHCVSVSGNECSPAKWVATMSRDIVISAHASHAQVKIERL